MRPLKYDAEPSSTSLTISTIILCWVLPSTALASLRLSSKELQWLTVK